MPGIARQGDIAIGVCPSHESPVTYTAIIVGVSANVLSEGVGNGYVGSVAVSSCGHTVILISGSATVLTNGMSTSRITDMGTNPGPCTIVSGAGTVIAGG